MPPYLFKGFLSRPGPPRTPKRPIFYQITNPPSLRPPSGSRRLGSVGPVPARPRQSSRRDPGERPAPCRPDLGRARWETLARAGPVLARLSGTGMNVAALWGPIEFLNFLRVGSWSFWGSGGPRGPRKAFKKVGGRPPGPAKWTPRPPGPAPHINFHEKSAPQTYSSAKWFGHRPSSR